MSSGQGSGFSVYGTLNVEGLGSLSTMFAIDVQVSVLSESMTASSM